MEEELANLRLLDEEEEAFQEEVAVVDRSYQFCLVGRCLTDSVVHFPSLRNIMANLWHPIGGICITDLIEKSFIEYDTSILTLGLKKFMRIRARLDVSNPLKRKKKILIGKEMTVYARFQYKKLSLFCFISGKQGHSESFCPFRLRIEPVNIVFGWDISLRVVARWRVGSSDKPMDPNGAMRVWKVTIRVVNG
ncbi:hypothetical protein PVK06_033485 [Gossypium arboreum]|uniref:Zinc knuckle CX2CX4HX4C domain-containing protein n=1 Tax=Gossypium arboreum TaxID=29729 RepID=A0ABR0NBK0_GOSAR|nr:hypothetical protein PVK06_033485 [Gossypium arboreum]